MLNIRKIFTGITTRLFGQCEKTKKYISTKETHIDVPVPEKPKGKYDPVHTNRKRTRGRLIYYQIIQNHITNVVKGIKHHQQKHDTYGSRRIPVIPTEKQMAENHIVCLQRWGCAEYDFDDGITVWARDRKNATRKHENALKLKIA